MDFELLDCDCLLTILNIWLVVRLEMQANFSDPGPQVLYDMSRSVGDKSIYRKICVCI